MLGMVELQLFLESLQLLHMAIISFRQPRIDKRVGLDQTTKLFSKYNNVLGADYWDKNSCNNDVDLVKIKL